MFKKVFMCTLGLVLATTLYTSAQNNIPNNVKLEGNSEGIVFIPADEPFLLKEGMVPGDSVSGNIIIDNKYDVEYEIFMRAERVSKQEEYDLLNKLELTVYYKNDVIYNGPASGEDELSKNISLGKFKPRDKANLYAQVKLDGSSTGNEYKNKYAQVDWIFTAVNEGKETPSIKPDKPTTEPDKPTTEPDKPTTEPDKPTTEPDKPTTEPDKPTTELDKPTTEPDKPTTELDKPTTESDKPTTNTPSTGDNSIVIYIIVGLGALILLCRDKFKKIVKKR